MPLYELFCIAAHNPTSPVSLSSFCQLRELPWRSHWLTDDLFLLDLDQPPTAH
jgi:hypothetical protein